MSPTHAYQPVGGSPTTYSSWRSPNRRQVIVGLSALALFGIVVPLVSYAPNPQLADLLTSASSPFTSSSHSEAVPQGPPLCTLAEYDDGYWEMRAEGVYESMADMKIGQGLHPGNINYGWNDDFRESTLKPEEVQRILKAASYEWRTRSGCTLVPWDRKAFIDRLVKAYAGLWIIGDSVAQQHFRLLKSLIVRDDEPIYASGYTIHINKTHPDTKALLARNGVPSSRLDRPLARGVRNDRFVDRRLFYKVYAELGIENVKLIEGDEGDFWGSVMAESAQHRDSPDELLFENTIFVINSGAHWGRGTMSLENAEDMVAGYNATSVLALNALRDLGHHLDYYFRTTHPPHIDCVQFTEPNSTFNTYDIMPPNPDDEKHVKTFFRNGWDQFPNYNTIWRDIHRHEQEMGNKLRLIDTWRLGNQRPDSHQAPFRDDCLHPVPPTMANVWNHLIWHDAVVLRKERADKAQADAKAVKEVKQAKLIAEEEARLAADKEAKKKKAEEEEAKKVGVEGLPSEVIKPE